MCQVSKSEHFHPHGKQYPMKQQDQMMMKTDSCVHFFQVTINVNLYSAGVVISIFVHGL